MARFNHAFDIAFEVVSNCEDASDVTPEKLRDALLQRISDLDASYFPSKGQGWEWYEAVGDPFDTFNMDEE